MALDIRLQLKLAAAGKLRTVAPAVEAAWREAVAVVFARRLNALKKAVRQEIIAAGLGQKLANAFRSRLFRTSSGDLGGAAFSNAFVKRPGGRVDLLAAFQNAITITGGGRFLAIALTKRTSGRDERRRATPEDFPAGTFALVPLKRAGNFLLVEKASGDAFFLLVRRVTIGKRLSTFAAAVARAHRGLDEAVAKECERRLVAAFKKAA